MAGYFKQSKSNNALLAEREGKFPATVIEKRLKLPKGFVKHFCGFALTEWHHTSKFYNSTDYYDATMIESWMNGNDSAVGESFDASIREWKTIVNQSTETVIYENVDVKWLEWSGTRNYPVAKEKTAKNVTIKDSGKTMLTIILGDGTTFRKARNTRGFSFEVKSKESVSVERKDGIIK